MTLLRPFQWGQRGQGAHERRGNMVLVTTSGSEKARGDNDALPAYEVGDIQESGHLLYQVGAWLI